MNGMGEGWRTSGESMKPFSLIVEDLAVRWCWLGAHEVYEVDEVDEVRFTACKNVRNASRHCFFCLQLRSLWQHMALTYGVCFVLSQQAQDKPQRYLLVTYCIEYICINPINIEHSLWGHCVFSVSMKPFEVMFMYKIQPRTYAQCLLLKGVWLAEATCMHVGTHILHM